MKYFLVKTNINFDLNKVCIFKQIKLYLKFEILRQKNQLVQFWFTDDWNSNFARLGNWNKFKDFS